MNLQNKIKREFAKALASKDFNAMYELQVLINKALDKPDNLILLGDAYKYSHHKLYEEKTTVIYSYMESRGGKFDETVFFGLQYFLKRYLGGVAITQADLDEAYDYLGKKHGVFGREDVFNRDRFQYIIDEHGGRLPIIIKAVPEGTSVSNKNVLLTIENTDPNCYWLTNFLESLILQIWYPITVATLSREVRKIVQKVFDDTTDFDQETKEIMIDFVLNDFGFRGASSVQSASIGGAAHLVNFRGSDTTVSSKTIRDYYKTNTIFGLSIPATEHSIMTIKGEEGEIDMMKRTLQQYPTGIIACVSDSYDIFRACRHYWGGELKELVLSRPSELGNNLVIRPDSGHVINSLREIFRILFEVFEKESTVNSKGFKVLPPQVRVIQGDGVNINSIIEVYEMLRYEKISAENLVFGMGGKLLQAEIDRDTQKFATKVCYTVVDGVERDVVKRPTEMNADGELVESFKTSKRGKQKLVKTDDGYITISSHQEGYDEAKDELYTVFKNGTIIRDYTFEQIRTRAKLKEGDTLTIKEKY